MSPSQALNILVVDDQSSVRAHLAACIDALGHRFFEADGADWALELFRRHQPDIVLLDVNMPGKDGYWLASEIRRLEVDRWTPIIFLSAMDEDQDLLRGIESGGDDYLVKPISSAVLGAKLRAMHRLQAMQQRIREMSAQLQEANRSLTDLALRDDLTGTFNRRGFDHHLASELAAARREGAPLTLILCDVDAFKRYNDALGHLEGDACLKHIGALLQSVCRRPRDRAARYGGEEFALILPHTPKSGAVTFANGVASLLASKRWPHPDSQVAPHVTLSGGITTCIPTADTTPETLLRRADEALYTAKAQGRNRFFSYEIDLASAHTT